MQTQEHAPKYLNTAQSRRCFRALRLFSNICGVNRRSCSFSLCRLIAIISEASSEETYWDVMDMILSMQPWLWLIFLIISLFVYVSVCFQVFSSLSLDLLPERAATLMVYDDVVQIVSGYQGKSYVCVILPFVLEVLTLWT